VLIPDRWTRGEEREPGTFHDLRYRGNLAVLVVIGPHHGGQIGHKPWPAGRPAIFADGATAPLVTSFTASRVFSRSVDVTKAHNMTLASGASFNSGIFLAAAAVDRALKGSMVGERINNSFGREVREKEMS
jgi:hypothetical protein